jgi:hypothetical protein
MLTAVLGAQRLVMLDMLQYCAQAFVLHDRPLIDVAYGIEKPVGQGKPVMGNHHMSIWVFGDGDALPGQWLGNLIRFKQEKGLVVLDRQRGRHRALFAPCEHLVQ